MPLREISPNRFTICAAPGVRIGLAVSPTNVVGSRAPEGKREAFSTGPTPVPGVS